MKTSYIYQGVNLFSSVLILIMVLSHLSPGMYLQWVLFQAFAGGLVQLEQSLSAVVTRYISRAEATGSLDMLGPATQAARIAYRLFAFAGAGLMFVAGYLYFSAASGGRFSPHWIEEWAIFCIAYCLFYNCVHYGCLLIAFGRSARFASIGLFIRTINAIMSAGLLFAGFAVLGLSVSMFLTYLVGALLFRKSARSALAAWKVTHAAKGVVEIVNRLEIKHILLHASYIFMSYGLYRVGLLLSAGTALDTRSQASYGLALQIFNLVLIIAAVPLSMRIAPLVAATVSGDRGAMTREIALLAAYSNLVFVAAATVLILFSGPISAFLPTRGAILPPAADLAALSIAFLIEINILILVNVLLASQHFAFAVRYHLSAACAVFVALALWWLKAPFYVAFVWAPAAVQLAIGLPLIAGLLKRQAQLSMRDYAKHTLRHIGMIVRHPIRVGLAFR